MAETPLGPKVCSGFSGGSPSHHLHSTGHSGQGQRPGCMPGRFDQVMIDHYDRSLKSQTLTRDAALELIQNFFVMLSVVDVFVAGKTLHSFGQAHIPESHHREINPRTGLDATNEVTFLVLDAIQNTRTVQPSHYVRWHKRSPDKFKMKVAETIRLGTGFPAVANDEAYIQAMITTAGMDPRILDLLHHRLCGARPPGCAVAKPAPHGTPSRNAWSWPSTTAMI